MGRIRRYRAHHPGITRASPGHDAGVTQAQARRPRVTDGRGRVRASRGRVTDVTRARARDASDASRPLESAANGPILSRRSLAYGRAAGVRHMPLCVRAKPPQVTPGMAQPCGFAPHYAALDRGAWLMRVGAGTRPLAHAPYVCVCM